MITVIIIAFEKRAFLKDAIESVLSQDLDSHTIEIILIKNFADKLDFLPDNLKVIDALDDISIGSKIIRAAENSNGEYISFLEDDDIFLPKKIKHIYNLLDSNPDVVYINNGFIKIHGNASDNYTVNTENTGLHDRFKFNKSTMDCDTYFRLRPDFNLSSITIRRRILLENRQLIVGKTHVVDTLLFALALNTGLNPKIFLILSSLKIP